ncbi:MAG: hypothetical protein E7543_06670 [Ruminococcaceae bacterium]|nr:hypothetical protein [Oscillospiraceae bacterium]
MINNIFDDIKYAYDLEAFSIEFRPERVYRAIDNFDCFVRAGEDSKAFIKEFSIAFQEGERWVQKTMAVCSMVDFPFSLEHFRWVWIAFSLVRLVKDFFDADHFNLQMKDKSKNTICCESALTKFMKTVNYRQLKVYESVRDYPERCIKNNF